LRRTGERDFHSTLPGFTLQPTQALTHPFPRVLSMEIWWWPSRYTFPLPPLMI